jgi:ketosteroid isomerase-like protein
MPEESVEIARQAVEAYNRGDRAAWFPLMDPQLEFLPAAEWPESGLLRGPEQVWDFGASLNETWEQSDFEIVEVIDPGSDIVALHLRRPVVGKASGIADVLDQWTVLRIRGGRVFWQRWFTSRAEALKAAGIPEQAMSEENVEAVKNWFAAMAEGDLGAGMWDADLIVDNTPEFPVTGPYRGYDGLQRWWSDLTEVIDGARIELDEATRLDRDKVLTIQRLVGNMTHTRIPLDARWAAIWIVRAGKLCRVSGYLTREEALKAAGLSE